MTVSTIPIIAAALLAIAGPAAAQLHQSDVILRAQDGRVQTGGFTSPDALVFPLRIYIGVFGDAGLPDRTTEPGFESVTGAFPGAAEVGVRLTAALRRWDGDDFLTIPDERMTVRKDAFTITTPPSDPVPPASGPALLLGMSDSPSGDFHEHPGYRLLAPATDGLYLLSGEVFVGTPGLAPSDTIFILFRQNFTNQAEIDEARAWIEANLIGGSCPTDWNHDGVVNSTDVSEFINSWFADQAAGTLIADFDGNGVVNSTDVSGFINAWFEAQVMGC